MSDPNSTISNTRAQPPQTTAVALYRTTRFAINPNHSSAGTNGFSARPAPSGLARFYEITLACTGTPDPETGYLIDIHALDDIVHTHLVPVIAQACDNAPAINPASLMPTLWQLAKANLPHPLKSITWSLTPYTKLTMNTTTPDHIVLRQRYEFSASHRLHADHLDAQTNRQLFGKCNNPNGHGHNYRVEPAISVPIATLEAGHCSPDAIDTLIDATILDQLDHKHLNADCPAFDQSKGGLMPSVENIAKYCFEQLNAQITTLGQGVQLLNITVWETDRTSCTYPALTP